MGGTPTDFEIWATMRNRQCWSRSSAPALVVQDSAMSVASVAYSHGFARGQILSTLHGNSLNTGPVHTEHIPTHT